MRLENVVGEIPEEPLDDPELLFHLYRTLDWSQRTISYELGVEKSRVLESLIRFNILRPWSNKQALERALDDGNTPAEIADAWCCSELTIRRWMDKHGIKKRPELTQELLEELYSKQKLTAKEIGDDLGYAPVEVYVALKEHDIETRDGSHRFR
jgi:DNA-directed RNA polymerase specialized sigma subunit